MLICPELALDRDPQPKLGPTLGKQSNSRGLI